MRKIAFLATCVALAAVACSDQPTANTNDTPSYRAAQGDRSEWTLIATWPGVPEDQAYFQGFVPCFNGGLGEDVYWWGPDALFYAKEVTTPSGITRRQGRIVLGGDGIQYYRGAITGHVWASDPFSFEGKTNFSDLGGGGFLIHETAEELVTNTTTGERARVLWMWHNHWDGSGNVVGPFRSGAAISCHILTH